jgi:hypothetical protein
MRQLIAREVNTISVRLTAIVAGRRSDIIKVIRRNVKIRCDGSWDGEKDSCALHALYIYLLFILNKMHSLCFVCLDMRNTKRMDGLRGLTLAAPRWRRAIIHVTTEIL